MRNFYRISLIDMLVLWILCSPCIAKAQFQTTTDKAIGVVEAVRELPDSIKTPNRYALIIGVGQYRDSQIPTLSACSNDASQLYNVLTEPDVGMFSPEKVTLLLDKDVIRRKVVNALDLLGRKAGKDDLVVIFFSGHGAIDERGRSYWVMQDSAIDDLRSSALSEIEITELLGEIKTNRLVTLIDTCYSASTAKLGRSKALIDLKKIYPKFTGDGRVAITASKGDQLSVVISDKQHPGYGFSAFAWHVISGMKGRGDDNKDGVVTVSELWNYVKDRTETTARQQGGSQQPQLKGQIGSKFLFTVDSQRLIANTQQTRQSLKALNNLFLAEEIDAETYNEGKDLLISREDTLAQTQLARRQIYIDLVKGELKPRYLQMALDAIETPGQRSARLEREAAERAKRQRQERISELLAIARDNDNKTDGKKALDALEELLRLDPSHGQALSLQKKISGYFGPNPGNVMTNSIDMKLVYILAGEFMMGSSLSASQVASQYGGKADYFTNEHPQHKVKISKGFYMGQTEVTQAQYQAVMGTNPSNFRGDNLPVEQVSWNDAAEFCRKLSQKEGKTYTLPTEAQWEYACRAGTKTVFSFGNNESSLDEYGWYGYENAGKTTHPVGTKKPNGFGLYDMHGNVWEWCRDYYDSGFYNKGDTEDPESTQGSSNRVLRGGCWSSGASGCRSALRGRYDPGNRIYYYLGFRIVLSVSSQDFQ